MSLLQERNLLAIAALAGLLLAIQPLPALAQFEVQQPEIHKGEVEIEYHGAYLSGRPAPPTEVKRHGHEAEIWFGITDWWAIGAAVEAEEERGEDGRFGDFELSEGELQNKFEILPLEGDGFGASILVVYGRSLGTGVPGESEKELRFGPILKAAKGPVSVTANLFPVHVFDVEEKEFEDGALEIEDIPDHWNFSYAWQVKYQKSDRLALGVEGFGEFEDIGGDLPGDDLERHRVGPVLYLSWEKGGHSLSLKDSHGDEDHGHEDGGVAFEMAFGVLFGLNEDTSDVALKWDFEIEF